MTNVDPQETARLISQGQSTINPVSKLPQTPDMVRAERDSLLISQAALLRQIKRLKELNRSRLDKMRKLRARIGT